MSVRQHWVVCNAASDGSMMDKNHPVVRPEGNQCKAESENFPTLTQDDFAPPTAVRQVDLAEKHSPLPKHSQALDVRASGLSRQLHMAPAGALSDFRLPPGAAATWAHVISGRKASLN